MQNDPTTSIKFFGDVAVEASTPPSLPVGYERISKAQTISTDGWACLAYQQYDGVYGLLIYGQEETTPAFYPAEDALHLLQRHAEWGFDLIGYCVPDVVGEPGRDQLDINGPWWSKHAVFACQYTTQTNEEVPNAME